MIWLLHYQNGIFQGCDCCIKGVPIVTDVEDGRGIVIKPGGKMVAYGFASINVQTYINFCPNCGVLLR